MRGPNAKSGSRWRGRSRSGINPARPCLWEGLPAGPVRVASNEGRDAHNVRFELHCRRRYSQSECRLWIVCCRFGHDPGAKQSDTPITVSGNDRFVLVPAGRGFRKLPLTQISPATTGHQPIAVAAESNRHRQLRPRSSRSPQDDDRRLHLG